MLEVPAAAVSIDTMLDVVDFVSIGSHDLVARLAARLCDNCRHIGFAQINGLRGEQLIGRDDQAE